MNAFLNISYEMGLDVNNGQAKIRQFLKSSLMCFMQVFDIYRLISQKEKTFTILPDK